MDLPGRLASSESQPEENRQHTRRRFIRGVGVAVPVIMTIRSSSALSAQCFAPSAAASIALLHSRLDREQAVCLGRSPGFWKNAARPCHPNHNFWVTAGGEGVLFSTIFGSGFPGKTLKDVLGLKGNQNYEALGRHLAAAYLNHQIVWVPDTVLSIQDLIDMWNGRAGSYSPTAGVTWGAAQIVTYLVTTFDEIEEADGKDDDDCESEPKPKSK